ncbi:hypothetical protein PPROV_000408000 [Pycnococcus provasolii]|uniref:Aspartyl/asparaginy/proline hydroxylase domain-containing protein n=1 Tax=Pycnococcus provasolii TaxID=41880 RepID=A0A830HEY3_9CHLO|nr:hypothetical protein PPROV_000408000 [Pycnococcus provasolii]
MTRKRVFVADADGTPYAVTVDVGDDDDDTDTPSAVRTCCVSMGRYFARILCALIVPPLRAIAIILMWPIQLLVATFTPKVARALPVELSDRWWWGSRGGGCDATGLKQARAIKAISFVAVRCLPRCFQEYLDRRAVAKAIATGKPAGSMLSMVDEYNALSKAPTIAAGMKALGMKRLDEWFWRPNEISRTPNSKQLTHPMLRPVQYVPIPTHPFTDPTTFPWVARIESQYLVVKEELQAVLRSNRGWAEPLLPDFMGNAFRSAKKGKTVGASSSPPPPADGAAAAAPAPEPAGSDSTGDDDDDDDDDDVTVGDWQQLMFNTPLGTSIDENKEAMPKTWELLKSIPGFVDNNFAMISSLRPGGRIAPHVGHTNLVTRLHLAIDVPEPSKSAIRVGNDVRTWEEGKVLLLNDAFDHEVWTFGTKNRTVLFADIWNPSLTAEDIAALKPHWDAQKNTLGVMAASYEQHAKKQGREAGGGANWYVA